MWVSDVKGRKGLIGRDYTPERHIANEGWLSYVPSAECTVGWMSKTLPLCSKNLPNISHDKWYLSKANICLDLVNKMLHMAVSFPDPIPKQSGFDDLQQIPQTSLCFLFYPKPGWNWAWGICNEGQQTLSSSENWEQDCTHIYKSIKSLMGICNQWTRLLDWTTGL